MKLRSFLKYVNLLHAFILFYEKVFTEKDEDFDRDRGNKEFGSLGRSASKAHLSMSQYLDRCVFYSLQHFSTLLLTFLCVTVAADVIYHSTLTIEDKHDLDVIVYNSAYLPKNESC